MEELLPLVLPPELRPPKGAKFAVQIVDPKTQQGVLIGSKEPLAAFVLDDDSRVKWRQGEKHPDAVVVAQCDGENVVLFLELTKSVKMRKAVDPMERKLAQLRGGISHFHPAARSGGDRGDGDHHHDYWEAGEDLPQPTPESEHRVGGIILGFHQQTRYPVEPMLIGERRIPRAIWSPVPSSRGQASVTMDELVRLLGWS